METYTNQICEAPKSKEELCMAEEIEGIIRAEKECIKTVNLLILELIGAVPPDEPVQANPNCIMEHVKMARSFSRLLEERVQDLMHSVLG